MTRVVATEAELPVRTPGLGAGWMEVLRVLNRRLHALDPPARAGLRPDDAGGALVFLYDPERRAAARALCDAAERELWQTCERCGAPGDVHIAAQAIQILCTPCGAPSERTTGSGRVIGLAEASRMGAAGCGT